MALSGNNTLALRFQEDYEALSAECKTLISNLPKEEGWKLRPLYLYQGAWLPMSIIAAYLAFRDNFRPRDDDLILATVPKSGTTWLKALSFAVVHRDRYSNHSNHPLLGANSHEFVKFLEMDLYDGGQIPNLDGLPSPRLFATHFPFSFLPDTMRCRVVFLCRNPGDNFISLWKFINKLLSEVNSEAQLSLEEAFELFCKGRGYFGSYWDTVLGYWKASKKEPDRVLFLNYEELKDDPLLHVKRLAEFLRVPFTEEEESEGVVEKVIKLCSFESLSTMEVNKTGKLPNGCPNEAFFRLGKVGDWANYFTSEMVERINGVTNKKMEGSGLNSTLSLSTEG